MMPGQSYQHGLNLLRALNLDIAAIQVLTRQEIDPPFTNGGLNLVDSETNGEIRLRWNPETRREYRAKLAHHNSELRSFCHKSGIHYSLYVNDRDMADFVFATLPAIGLFK
jgi:hypothetical protein